MNDKQQLAAMGAHMAEQPMCMAKRIEELEEQVRVMAGLLQEAFAYIDDDQDHSIETGKPLPDNCTSLLSRIDAALSGKLPAQHQDDAAVDRFAIAMKAKMAAAREKGRGGWDDPNACSVEFRADLLVGHVGKGNQGNFEDIANLAMMLHQRGADPTVLAGKLPVVSEDWQLVPVEPTREMMAAAMSAVTQPQDLLYSQSGWGMNEMAARTRYRAMLAAAPKPEAK